MSLAKQSKQIRIAMVATTNTNSNRVDYKITLQNKDIEIVPEFFSGGAFDESIGGKRISNLRGYRLRINLSYNAAQELTQKSVGSGSFSDSTYRDMFNEIMSCFATGTITESLGNKTFDKMWVYIPSNFNAEPNSPITVSASSGAYMGFIPEDMSYTQTYTNQIGRFTPSITLVSETLMPSIPSELEGVL